MTSEAQKAIRARVFVNAPWYELKNELLPLFIREGLQPEISLEGDCLYRESEQDFTAVARELDSHGLACTLHAPFFDLAPGALDPEVLAVSRAKLRRAAALLPIFGPRSLVCHLGFERNKQGYKYEPWRQAALATWQELAGLATAAGSRLMLENTYETDPAAHEDIFSALQQQAGFCLDVGHLLAFARSPWQDWLPRLSPWLGQLHLHDNHGEQDQHLAPGRGDFDFSGLFTFLGQQRLSPLITLEPHSKEDLWAALDYLEQSRLLETLTSAA